MAGDGSGARGGTGTDGARVPHRDDRDAFLITDAQQSLEDQQRARVRKYLTLMAFRVPALVIAGIVYSSTHNGLLALAIVAISIPIPWVAVLIANDRPPRKRGEAPQYKYGADHSVVGPMSLGGPAAGPESRVVDSTTDTGREQAEGDSERGSR
ncbi:DUF3099 domain-containing protein [Gordonia sp. SL306]|uniref:DUF3099 domain-containing protein n=1 Tax=Gordonia sp. SL306 TaxID=2995145 RepID=UPI002270B714|nr:DUF3099 domain-containing protein [Gordonia sp. SL306]WAC55226.1 DUF3099 domain-containing protein [Gordonia sp. SL306]